ncbi:hypothetical protein NE865_03712 [Phthorimaea operculella]|nr:hypothetical protein NE865_03712 [Phthorimaea operculella]
MSQYGGRIRILYCRTRHTYPGFDTDHGCSENTELKAKVDVLEQKLTNLEKEKRRCNLVFFGIVESEKSEGELVDCIKDIIIDTGVHLDSQEISKAQRIGRWSKNKNRPVVVSLTSSWKKSQIWQNRSSLPPGMYIREDYTKEVLQKRKELQPQLEEERKKGNRAFIVYDRLVVKAPRDRSREKRKREESGSPNLDTQKKINTQDEKTKGPSNSTTKETVKTLKPSILNFVDKRRQTETSAYPKN